MPTYDYACPSCGAFAARQTMALYDQPLPCPNCATPSPRALSIPLYLGVGRPATRLRVAAEAADSVGVDSGYQRLKHSRACACCK